MNSKKNAFYAQSGGVTAVINASACGVIETAAKSKQINAVYNYNLNLDELERLTFLEISKNCLDNNNNKSNAKESICNIPK